MRPNLRWVFFSACCLVLVLSLAALSNSVVFITSTDQSGSLGGLSGADTLCQQRASAAGLVGTYRAWLSTAAVSASSRLIHSDYPYQLVDGSIVANNWNDLTDGALTGEIHKSELNEEASFRYVFTGTTAAGASTGTDCTGWIGSVTGGTMGRVAGVTPAGAWSQTGTSACTSPRGLYCFQQMPNTLRIVGRVLSSSGRPITHARIEISGGGLGAPLVFYTNRGGDFSSSGLPTGPGTPTYTIGVSQRRFSFSPAQRAVTFTGTDATANFTGTPGA